MEHIIKWLENDNEIYLIIFLAIIGVIAFVIVVMLIGASAQGRKITFVPPSIGEKPSFNESLKKELVSTAEAKTKSESKANKVYDLFVSAPMTSVEGSEYQKIRKDVLVITQHFRSNCGAENIHYVGERVVSPDVADPPAISIEDDLNNLAKSKGYILIYPKPLLTSCIVEAGYALGLGIPSIYFVKNKADLPYMLREAAASTNNSVSIYEYKDTDDLIQLIDRLKNRLFKEILGDGNAA